MAKEMNEQTKYSLLDLLKRAGIKGKVLVDPEKGIVEYLEPQEDSMAIAKKISAEIERILGDNLLRVILFGSRARGDFGKNSDYDFMVLVKDTSISSWPLRTIDLRKQFTEEFPSVDILVLTSEEFEEKFLFSEDVKKEGIVLYGQAD
ncbi:nucleotidyltransferase domain-containing protein [Paenibacillus medicaginis]|uniref:Nucleotidyltransferase domain-containing protein n=1 Tax=Paenibacillus medicaginis TaxID=1470560 RepID=A0ABV5C4D0_9BACL